MRVPDNLISILSEDINQLQKFISEVFNELLQVVILVRFSAIAFYMVSPITLFVGYVFYSFYYLGKYFYEKLVTKRYLSKKKCWRIKQSTRDNIGGIGVIKVLQQRHLNLKE